MGIDAQIFGAGPNSNQIMQVDPSAQAARTSLRPLDHVVGGVLGGHYMAAMVTGAVTGRAAGDVLLGWRWGSSAKLCVITRVAVAATIVTAQAAQIQEIDYDLIKAQSITTNYVTGSTKQAFTAAGNKMRSTHAPTELASAGDVYLATTGAATGSVATLDPLPLAYACLPIAGNTATYAGNLGMVDIFKMDKAGGHPLVLANGEGFACRVGTAQGATVAVKSAFIVEWAELTSY